MQHNLLCKCSMILHIVLKTHYAWGVNNLDEMSRMTFTTQTHAGITFADRWANARANMAGAYTKRKMYRTTLSELSGLTNRELADIGFNRSMIQRLAMEAAGYL